MAVNQMYDENEAAEYLGCSVAALQKWRVLRKGPTYVKVGRLVRYREADLVAFLDANCVQPGLCTECNRAPHLTRCD